ncbi:MAG: alpha/beta hydrolase [Phycisphaerales bacterium]|nr:alpha/beta hydrolase [Phycisphaerales bacterium]MCB9836560.1 alpha/beta hydrolase [Phycisphaera sp.]
MTGFIALLAIGLAILWLLGVITTAWRLTHPNRRTYAFMLRRGLPGDPSELPGEPRAFTQWTLTSRGRELPVWDIVGDAADGPVIILTHGWGNSRYDALLRLAPFLPRASRVVAWDQPGHGDAPGTCDLGVGETQDLAALIERIDAERIVLFGWSLGAGVSIAAASKSERVIAVLAQAPYRLAYTPAKGVLSEAAMPWRATLWPAMMLIGLVRGRKLTWAGQWPGFDRAAYAAKLAAPLLVIHGEQDRVCPLEDGRSIAEAAPDGRLVVLPGAPHNGLWANPETKAALEREIGAFLDGVLSEPSAT